MILSKSISTSQLCKIINFSFTLSFFFHSQLISEHIKILETVDIYLMFVLYFLFDK